jgi:flavin reductase (DIM6/NTAB) family NADH-FMN oxidoreductase RutF
MLAREMCEQAKWEPGKKGLGKMMSADPIDRHVFRGLMRNVPGQVSIVATAVGERRKGLTASAVCSLTDLPPTVIVCVNQAAGAHDLIIESGYFSINALAASQERIARVFSGVSGVRGEQRFETGDWSTGITGAPILASAVCRLECRLSEYRAASSHTVFFGQVIAGSASHDASPLLHLRGSYVGVEQRRLEEACFAGASGK